MQEDKIILILQELAKVREGLKEVKKDLKREEKIDDEQYQTMKKTAKEMRAQIKDFETDWKAELNKDGDYQKLVEMKVEKEEEAANLVAEMYHIIKKLPQKAWETNMDTENGPVRVQVEPDMRVFVNGKEEKKRA
ncbi:hypothetical protein HN748_00915 [Candidatus Peregrinibacteria bacterium]|jgi:phenylalanyl-tRNA synthetase alpha subunit|nr:hypothetical protein [Candidatus Peregrinibacteria bacterium]MBT7702772.1 hypothetical protein [Candidatus Peregrinibacteria bacterium]